MLNGQTPQFTNGDFENSPCDVTDCSATSYDCIPGWSNFTPFDNSNIMAKPLLHYDCINAVSCGGNSALWLFSNSGSGENTSASGVPIASNPLFNYSPRKFSALKFDAYTLDYGGLADLDAGFYFGGSHTSIESGSSSDAGLDVIGNPLTLTLEQNSQCTIQKILLPSVVQTYEYVGFSLGDGVQGLQSGEQSGQEILSGRSNVVIDNVELCDFVTFEQLESCTTNEVCFYLDYNSSCFDLSCQSDPGYVNLSILNSAGNEVSNSILLESTELPQEVCFALPNSGAFRLEMDVEVCSNIHSGFHFDFDYQNPCIETVVTTDQIWTAANTGDNGYLVSGDIIVRSGATLTIEDGVEIAFCQNASLIVEANATVNLYGHLIACDGHWQGVDVYGLQSATTQSAQGGIRSVGQLKMHPKSLIKNAIIAVDLSSANGIGGGIIQADHAFFIDFNKAGVHFSPFENHNSYTGFITPNFSYLNGCTFLENEDFVDTQFPLSMIDLEGVRGVRVKGCHFENQQPTASLNFFGIGIRSRNSNFIATFLCDDTGNPSPDPCMEYTRNTFKGLTFGIHNSNNGLELDKGFVVRESAFHQCNFGIYNLNASFGKIVNNDFYLGDSKEMISAHQFGTFFRGMQSGFTLEANHFQLDEVVNHNNTIGSLCQDIGETNNYVESNTYTGLLYGNLSNGKNFMGNMQGLVYLCNENDNPTAISDFAVTDEGIRSNQGREVEANGFLQYLPAGNYFSHAANGFSDFNNGGGGINYYVPNVTDGYGSIDEIPEEGQYTANTISLEVKDNESYCSTHYHSPNTPRDGIVIDDEKQLFDDAKGQWAAYRAQYCDKSATGSSKGLYSKVSKETESAADLKSELLTASPFVSLEILSAMIQNSQLSASDKMEILLANPQAGYDDEFFNSTSLTQAEVNTIRENADTPSDKSNLEMNITYYRSQMDLHARAVIQEVQSYAEEIDTNFMADWYERLATPTADYKLAELYVRRANSAMATDWLSTFSDRYCEWNAETALHQDMMSYFDLLIQLQQSGLLLDKQPDLVQAFYDMSQSATAGAAHAAESIYGAVTDSFFVDYKLLEGVSGLGSRIDNSREDFVDKQQPIVASEVIVYPNPAKAVVHFRHLEKGTQRLVIRDITGRFIQHIQLEGTSCDWNTNELQNGIYFYSTYTTEGLIATGKIVVNK